MTTTTKTKQLKWNRGEQVSGHREYKSKCGRYLIIQRKYVLPFASVGYTLFIDGKKVGEYGRFDLLAEAKAEAQEHADEEQTA